MTPIVLAGLAAIAAGAGTLGWKLSSWWWSSRVEQAQAAKAATDELLTKERTARAALELQLATERRTWADAEGRRNDVEARLRAEFDHARKELLDAASRDPALAGDRLDEVLGAGRGVTARGNAAAPGPVPGPASAPGRARGGDDTAR